MTNPLTESRLDFDEYERQFRRDLLRAETAIKEGARKRAAGHAAVISLASHQRIGQEQANVIAWRECDSRWGGPRIPRRPELIKVGRRSLLERFVDFLTRPRLSLRARLSLAWTRVRASLH